MNRVWSINVLGGNFNHGTGSMIVEGHHFSMNSPKRWFFNEKIPLDQLTMARPIEQHETGAGLAATLGLGAAGLALLGPLGMIGGFLLGGRRKQEVLVIMKFADGRTCVATMSPIALNFMRCLLGVL